MSSPRPASADRSARPPAKFHSLDGNRAFVKRYATNLKLEEDHFNFKQEGSGCNATCPAKYKCPFKLRFVVTFASKEIFLRFPGEHTKKATNCFTHSPECPGHGALSHLPAGPTPASRYEAVFHETYTAHEQKEREAAALNDWWKELLDAAGVPDGNRDGAGGHSGHPENGNESDLDYWLNILACAEQITPQKRPSTPLAELACGSKCLKGSGTASRDVHTQTDIPDNQEDLEPRLASGGDEEGMEDNHSQQDYGTGSDEEETIQANEEEMGDRDDQQDGGSESDQEETAAANVTCSNCCQPRHLVNREKMLCEDCVFGEHYSFLYECSGCHGEEVISFPLWMEQATPNAYSRPTWKCHQGCPGWTWWRILPSEIEKIPKKLIPSSWHS